MTVRAQVASEISVPTRYGSAPEWAERFARPMFALAGPGARMRGEELDDLVSGLMRRDELADALVRAIREEHAVTMPQVRAGMAEGIESVADPHPALRAFFEEVERRPDWVDDDLLARGGAAARRVGKDGFDILAFGSLLGGYRSGGALQPLVRTGRFDDTLNRVGETGQWWLACTAPGGLDRDGEGWRLSVHVRVMHAFVNYQLERDPDWDWEFRGVPINAYDRAGTIGSFSTSYLLQARALGIRVTRDDAAAIMHLWSYVGWLMGVEERWLPRTERVGRRVLANIIAGFSAPEKESEQLGTGLIRMHDSAPGISRWRRWYERERSLSMATFLNLGIGMRDVGQPVRPPWYPAYRIGANVVWTQLVGRLPGGRALLDRRAQRALERMERLQYAGNRPPIAPVPDV
ncbi:MAG TPA: oxygenase MpaB family protein [Marmoricola sp.]|nr:oxygenase MpaB family protein [Marmoricola sp.]